MGGDGRIATPNKENQKQPGLGGSRNVGLQGSFDKRVSIPANEQQQLEMELRPHVFESKQIAQCLCERWAPLLRGGYTEYLSAHLGRPLKNKFAIASFYIDEMSYGDVESASFGSLVKSAWTADARGLHVRTYVHDFTEVNGFFKVPSIKFLADKEVLALGETFGLGLYARKKYRMVLQDSKVSLVDEQIVRIAMSKAFQTE